MQNEDHSFSFKALFVPFTTAKAIQWIIIIGLIVFFNGLFNGFVGDDVPQIVDNIPVHSIGNTFNFFTGSTFYNGDSQNLIGRYYKPFMEFVFSCIYTFFGPNYFMFHSIQLMFYIANVIFLFLFLKSFLKRSFAFILSLIFLVHPINSESVYYISATQEVLFFFFGIFALCMLTYAKSLKQLFFISFCLFLSLLSKETGILFVIGALVYEALFRKRYFLPLLGFLFIFFCLYLGLRVNAVDVFMKPLSSPIDILPLQIRLINIPEIFLFYIKTFAFPFGLSFFHQWAFTKITFSNFFLPATIDLLSMSVLVFFGVFLYKKDTHTYFRIYLFFFIIFLMGIALHLQILPLDVTAAERWFYFPIIGILGMLGVLSEAFNINVKNKWIFTIAAVIVVVLAMRTFIRSFDWRDEFTLVSHDITVSQNDYSLENGLANELMKQNKYAEAKKHALRSIQLYPNWNNYNNLGVAYIHLGEYSLAQKTFLKALTYGDYYVIYENLADLTLVSGNPKENINFVKSLIKKFPQDAKLWLYLAVLDYKQGNVNSAKIEIEQAYKYSQTPLINSVYNSIMSNQKL